MKQALNINGRRILVMGLLVSLTLATLLASTGCTSAGMKQYFQYRWEDQPLTVPTE